MKNGQTGPRTTEGKAIAAQNARKHGILSECPVIPGLESAEDWAAHRTAFYESYQPIGVLEASFVERVALGFWRLNRVTRYERDLVAESYREWNGLTEDDKTWDEWCEERERFQERAQFVRVFARLADSARVDPDLVHELLATLCWKQTEAERRSIRLLEQRVAVSQARQFEDWTAGLLRRALSELSAEIGTPMATLLATAEEWAECGLSETEGALLALEEQRRQAQAHTHIPAPEEQARICRYEAHLSRELYKALRELNALQSHRTRAQLPPEPPKAIPQPPAASAVPVTPPPPDAPALPDARRKTKDADAPAAEPASRRIASSVAPSDPSGAAAPAPAECQPAPGNASLPQTTDHIPTDHTFQPLRALNRVRALLSPSGPH